MGPKIEDLIARWIQSEIELNGKDPFMARGITDQQPLVDMCEKGVSIKDAPDYLRIIGAKAEHAELMVEFFRYMEATKRAAIQKTTQVEDAPAAPGPESDSPTSANIAYEVLSRYTDPASLLPWLYERFPAHAKELMEVYKESNSGLFQGLSALCEETVEGVLQDMFAEDEQDV